MMATLFRATWFRATWFRATLGFVLVAALAGAAAPKPPTVAIELNRLEPHDGNCRAYLVFRNPGALAYSGFKLDLVVFDRNGIIAQRLAVEAAPLHADKIEVKIFDIPQLACAKIGSILVNDVLGCRDAEGAVADCVSRISTSSKLDVSLMK
jgi:hypothetical protein